MGASIPFVTIYIRSIKLFKDLPIDVIFLLFIIPLLILKISLWDILEVNVSLFLSYQRFIFFFVYSLVFVQFFSQYLSVACCIKFHPWKKITCFPVLDHSTPVWDNPISTQRCGSLPISTVMCGLKKNSVIWLNILWAGNVMVIGAECKTAQCSFY